MMNQNKEYAVWVGGVEVNDFLLSENEANELARKINSEIDEKIDKFTNTYGRFEQEPEGLLEIMRSIKFPMEGDSLSKRSIESRKKQ